MLPESQGIQPFTRSPSTRQPARLVPSAFLFPFSLGFAGLRSNDASEHVCVATSDLERQVAGEQLAPPIDPASQRSRALAAGQRFLLKLSHPYAARCANCYYLFERVLHVVPHRT